jgi:molecular chaperone HtpG
VLPGYGSLGNPATHVYDQLLVDMSVFVSEAEVKARLAESHPSAFGVVNLTHIREQVAEIVKLIGRGGMFEEYTLHDMSHIDDII